MTGIFFSTRHFNNHLVAVGDLKRTRAEELDPGLDLVSETAEDEKSAMGGIKRRRDSTRVTSSGCSDDLSVLLGFLRSAALGPWDEGELKEGGREKKRLVLQVRKAMFVDAESSAYFDEFPFLKKKRHKILERSGGLGSRGIMNHPTRKSKRTVLSLGDSEMLRKRAPVDPAFQVDVPDWTGPPNMEEDSEDHKLTECRRMGTKLWPIEGDSRQVDEGAIGKGRSSSCFCTSPGSADCIRFHVKMSRIKLISELGSAFASLGFDDMGEEVSKEWSQEEQMKFDDLVKANPVSEGKSFLEPALVCFASKSRQEIISYYFNVFLVRWMSLRTRYGSETVDSDDSNMGSESDSNN